MLLILFILIGCGKAELKDKKNENNSITDIDRLLGEWESIEDKFIVEIANTNKKNIYKLKFSGEDSNATDLNADDATLSNPNENLYVFKSDKGFSDDEIIKYANTRGVYPYKVNRIMNWNEVVTEVRKSNAIWGAWRGTGNYKGAYHAIDVIGTYYENTFGEFKGYWVWNPWYKSIDLVEAKSSVVYSVPNGSFIWERSVTNW